MVRTLADCLKDVENHSGLSGGAAEIEREIVLSEIVRTARRHKYAAMIDQPKSGAIEEMVRLSS